MALKAGFLYDSVSRNSGLLKALPCQGISDDRVGSSEVSEIHIS